ncbi:MAG: hypothetical protein J6X03_05435, partial [Bacilli bacterium]|nr:hypothetical protein [Bacilli bacterium]
FSYFSEEEREFFNSNRFKEVIKFKQNPSENLTSSLKRDIKMFNQIVKRINALNEGVIVVDHFPGVPKEVRYDTNRNYEHIFALLQNIRPIQLKQTIYSNPEAYKQLSEFLAKSKILANVPLLETASEDAHLPIDENLIAGLINNYSDILNTINQKSGPRVGLVDYVVEADYYDSESNRYRHLFGDEDFRYIKNNPGPNSSIGTRKERLETGTDLIRQMWDRDYLTIPPQDENYLLPCGKVLNVTIGDLHNIDNLTYGERTGACMRINGAGKSLFDFCLLDNNGFHMVFRDPENKEFVSRVSGFRNGNTAWLNQGRESVNPKYTNQDLIDCIYQAAPKIIEQAKSNGDKIDNVVISSGYIFRGKTSEIVDLNVSNIKEGLGDFYSDVSGQAIVLATTAENADFAPVVLGKNVQKYPRLKPKAQEYFGAEALKEVEHLQYLKEVVSGKDITEVKLEDKEVQYCYATDDWGVYVDGNNEVGTISVVDNPENLYEMNKYAQEFAQKMRESLAAMEVQ